MSKEQLHVLVVGARQQAAHAFETGPATALRVTPWRLFLLEGAAADPDLPCIPDPEDPLLRVHAHRLAPGRGW